MTHSIWPLFDLRVVTPRLELRYITDELAAELAELAARGVHDPDFMPFTIPWTDAASPILERNTMQWYWRCRAETSAEKFHLDLAVVADGVVIGTTGLGANDFGKLRQFESGSWLGHEYQGKGLGKEMRQATLHLGFDGLGATLATTAAFADNAPSLGVTRHLGYRSDGTRRVVRRGIAADTLHFDMTVDYWRDNLRRDDIGIAGLDAVLPLLGLGAERPTPDRQD